MRSIAMISKEASPLAAVEGVEWGGQNVYVTKLAEQLALNGYQVDIYTRVQAGDLPEIVPLFPNVRVIQVVAGPVTPLPKEELLPHMDEFARNMEAFIERNEIKYELIHAHFFISAWVAYQLKRSLNIPYLVTFHALGKVRRKHQGEADKFPVERIGMEAVVATDADMLIAECPQEREDLIGLYGADPQKITLIPAGYDPQEILKIPKHHARKKLGLNPEAFYVLQLGRMVPRKGVETVIEAVAHLTHTSKDRELSLLVVGGESETADPQKTPEIGRLITRASELGIRDKVIFLGRKKQAELSLFYSAANVFVSVPWYEPFGMTPLESMACGTPVIGSRVGGIKYTVVDGKTGILVPPKNPLALANAIRKLMNNPNLADNLGAEGKRRVRQFFTWEKVGAQMIRLYERIERSHLLERQRILKKMAGKGAVIPMRTPLYMSKGGRSVRTKPLSRFKLLLWVTLALSQLIRRLF